jgi:hypothetical protein
VSEAARPVALALLGLCLLLVATAPARSAADEEDEEGDLQQRLTEREDKRRPLEPFRVPVWGHPLTLGGEYELELGWVRPRVLEPEVDGAIVREPDRLAMSHQLQLEAFYSIGEPLSVFAQVQGVWDEDLLGRTFEGVSDSYLERGEMWLYSEDVLDSGVSVDVGRLDFEDERRWWWDDELDAARATWEAGDFEIALALAYELASDRSDQSFVDPERERVLHWIAEATWDFQENHSFQLFLLHADDHSPTEQPGDLVALERVDDSDARLSWLGLRQTGIFDLGASGDLGYWLDTGVVHGRERAVEFGDPDAGRVEAEALAHHDVRGWAVDAGLSWLLPWRLEPRVFAGYAFGSGDATRGGDDRSYRQSALQANEPGFGGVERFDGYGLLLRPELSNLEIVTVGAGLSLLHASSLDLVYHHYRLDERSEDLRDSLLQFQLDGRHRDLGHALDLVLALEEWERLEFTIAAAALRTSNAFGSSGPDEIGGRAWVVGSFVAVRYAF